MYSGIVLYGGPAGQRMLESGPSCKTFLAQEEGEKIVSCAG